MLEGWRTYQAAELAAVGIDNDSEWVFTDGDGEPVHPHAVYEAFRRIVPDDAAGVAERLANPNPNPNSKKKTTKPARKTPVERRGNNRKNAA